MVTKIRSQAPKAPHLYLREWRKTLGLTQDQVADRINSTKSTISRYETGEREPDEATKAFLAYAYGCDVPDLYRLPDAPTADALLRDKSPDEKRKIIHILEAILKAS